MQTCRFRFSDVVDDVLVFSKRADDIIKDIQEIYKMKGGSGKARTLSQGQHGLFSGFYNYVYERRKYLTTLLKHFA